MSTATTSQPEPQTTTPLPKLGSGIFYAFSRFIAACIYRVTAHGPANIPDGGVLLLPNHSTWVDAVVLQLACPRPVRFLVFQGIYNIPWLNPIFRTIGAIPISQTRARSALEGAVEGVKRGEIVCIFPEGELSRSGTLLRLKRGFELIAREAGAPVVPVFLDELWGSIFSFDKGRYFTKWPKRVPYHVTVAFGEAIRPEDATTALVRERLLELGEFCYQKRPLLKRHLGVSAMRGLKRHMGRVSLIDGMDSSSISRGKLLGVAIALARDLKKRHPSKRIAVVLPPGKAAVIANLAVTLAGKVPVNLNFTAGRFALESAIRRGDIPCAITAQAMAKRLPDFPWPDDVVELDKALPAMKKSILLWIVLGRILPSRLLQAILGLPSTGDHEEAVLLFTSGSSGEPKGVVLSHRNLLGNVSQFSQMISLNEKDTMLACLPFFHSFGCTVTLWYTLIDGVRAVTYPTPLETAKNVELIHKYSVTMLLSTATFLRAYLRKATRDQLASLKLIVVGAEKLPRDLADAFEERFGKHVYEGYGLTETSPVVSTNLPDPATNGKESVQAANRPGSVGKLAPGIAAQIRDPDTGAHLTLHDSGMLWLRGPNIFEGYLNDPTRTAEVLKDGWFKTGDLARFDEDGFLFIEGRLSRFSKIGGEMVPHETIENNIMLALGLSPEDERIVAVTGVPDEAKGEALVVVAARDIDVAEVRAKLTEMGLPNLWIPKQICRTEKIPILASGKLDLKAVKDVALAGNS